MTCFDFDKPLTLTLKVSHFDIKSVSPQEAKHLVMPQS
jgi:hypothetical protein